MSLTKRIFFASMLVVALVACNGSNLSTPAYQTPIARGTVIPPRNNLSVRVNKVHVNAIGGDILGPSEVYFELLVIRANGRSARLKYPGLGTYSLEGQGVIPLSDFSLTINDVEPNEAILVYFLALEADDLSTIEESAASVAMDATIELLERQFVKHMTKGVTEVLAKTIAEKASLVGFIVSGIAGAALDWWQEADILGDYPILLTPENDWFDRISMEGQNSVYDMVVYLDILSDNLIPTVTEVPTPIIPTPTRHPSRTPSPRPPTATPRPTITPTPKAPYIVNFTLINAETNLPIPGYDPIANGAVISLSSLRTSNLDIRANTYPNRVGSVLFTLNPGGYSWHENESPYALMHDLNGDYSHIAWLPMPGVYTLTAIPYTLKNLGGEQGTSLTIQFTVVRE